MVAQTSAQGPLLHPPPRCPVGIHAFLPLSVGPVLARRFCGHRIGSH